MSIFRYIGFSYNDVSNSCAMFGEQDTTSTGPGVNTKIFSVPPFDCLKDDQCKDKKFPYCVDMQCSPCPKEWTSNEDFTFCYKHFDERKRFQDARTSCQAAAPANTEGDLASVSDQNTRELLSTLTPHQAWVDEPLSSGGDCPCLKRLVSAEYNAGCAPGWTLFPHTGRCYKLFKPALSWREAGAICSLHKDNGHLASVPDQETNDFLLTLVSDEYVWIGAHDADSEGEWQWSDGTQWAYTNWDGGQPTGESQDFLHLIKSTEKWGDFHETDLPYICQYYPGQIY